MAEKRIALSIGNDLYPNLSPDRQLKKAVNDAGTIADSLKALGFEVIVGTNLGRQAMIDKLAEFTARLEPGDTAAIFFAGHGVAIAGRQLPDPERRAGGHRRRRSAGAGGFDRGA